MSITVALGGCSPLSRAGQGITQGEKVQGAIKPPSELPSLVVRGLEDGAALGKLGYEGEGATAAKIKDWGETALTEVVDKGPNTYELYTDFDRDLDTILDSKDNCPDVFNPDQEASVWFGLGPGDACDSEDADSDEWPDTLDNCPNVWNKSQGNYDSLLMDGDEVGDACDIDMDADGILNLLDSDMDGDGYIYEEGSDMDGDGYIYTIDQDNDADNVLNEVDKFDWDTAHY
jgi:hypothetical protein